MTQLLLTMWSILLSLAPWLLLGMAIAGLLHVLLPRDFVHRQLNGRWGVLKAVALGVPLPLCSCGVIPAGLGLKQDGASNGAAVGFLISTPQTGVDSILVSASFLGWPFALFKVLSAAVTGLLGGLVAEAVDSAPDSALSLEADGATAQRRGLREAVDHAMQILRTIWRWIVFGVVVSALIEVLIPEGFFAGLSTYGAAVPVLAALAVSLPLYVCATASVPIAAALVAGGMPAGAAIVFLMAGPATNVATIGAILRGLGKRALAVYLVTIIAGSIVAALAFDFLLEGPAVHGVHHHGDGQWWAIASAILLLGLLARFGFDDLRRIFWRARSYVMKQEEAIEIGVDGMKCGGCVSTLENNLREQDGVTSVVVSLDPGRAVVHGTIDASRVRRIVEDAGFSVVDLPDTAPSRA